MILKKKDLLVYIIIVKDWVYKMLLLQIMMVENFHKVLKILIKFCKIDIHQKDSIFTSTGFIYAC